MRTIAEKVWDYLVKHKSPVTPQQLADRFLVSKGCVYHELRILEKKQVLDRIVIQKQHMFKIKD